MTEPADAVDRLLDKLKEFTAGLDADERRVLAALVGPGVALAHREAEDVEGFSLTWEPRRLPDHLAAAIRDRDLRVEGW